MNWFELLMKKRMWISRILGLVGVMAFLFMTSAWETRSVVVEESLFFAGVVLVAIGVVGRVWSLSYLVGNKAKKLVTEGPFSLCRNPLYLFSFIGVLGVCLCTETMSVALIVMPIFVIVHLRSVRNEERKLGALFGPEYEEYARRTPRFFPSFASFKESDVLTVNAVLFRKGATEVAMFIVMIGVLEMTEVLHEIGLLPVMFNLF